MWYRSTLCAGRKLKCRVIICRNANFREEVRKMKARVEEVGSDLSMPSTIIIDIGEFCRICRSIDLAHSFRSFSFASC